MESRAFSVHHVHMATTTKPKHHIREWRKGRGLTLEQTAERIGMSHQNLGRIERGLVPVNDELLELLAEALNCTIADLWARAGPSTPDSLWSIHDQLTPQQRVQLIEVAKVIAKTGTG